MEPDLRQDVDTIRVENDLYLVDVSSANGAIEPSKERVEGKLPLHMAVPGERVAIIVER